MNDNLNADEKREREWNMTNAEAIGALRANYNASYGQFREAIDKAIKALEANDVFNNIERPSHYTKGRRFEPKDVIRDWGLNFNLGNAVKYVARAGRKGDILEDLEKARQCLSFEIDAINKEREEND